MSTLKVNTIQDTTGNDALTIDSSGNVTASQGFVPSTQLSHRNLIINGAMNVSQRSTSTTGVTTTGDYRTCDRWRFDVSNLGTWTESQSNDAPNGFANSHKFTCTTADSSPDADDYILQRYKVEAQDLQQLGYGTSDAKDMTLSFWVKSNKTGVGTVEFQQEDNSSVRHNQNYTISSADTWEYKTMVIPGDTSGQIDDDNGAGLQIIWWITTGSTWTTGTLSSSGWQSSMPSANRNAGGTLTVGTAVSDYIAFTGFQLEVGSVATPFEHRSYGEELARCQRYYQKSYNQGTTPGTTTNINGRYETADSNGDIRKTTSLVQTMRTTPTITLYSQTGTSGRITYAGSDYSPELIESGDSRFRIFDNAGSSSNTAIWWHFTADAEL